MSKPWYLLWTFRWRLHTPLCPWWRSVWIGCRCCSQANRTPRSDQKRFEVHNRTEWLSRLKSLFQNSLTVRPHPIRLAYPQGTETFEILFRGVHKRKRRRSIQVFWSGALSLVSDCFSPWHNQAYLIRILQRNLLYVWASRHIFSLQLTFTQSSKNLCKLIYTGWSELSPSPMTIARQTNICPSST